MRIFFTILFYGGCYLLPAAAQPKTMISVTDIPAEQKIVVTINGQLFTQLLYADTLSKPVLFPILAADGLPITRGFPLAPRPDDPTDFPQHLGMWMNYEKVNGIDFWNNASAIPREKRHLYGLIKTKQILQVSSGESGTLEYAADWINQAGQVLLQEKTKLIFFQEKQVRWIDRVTELTAATMISMPDAADGLFAIRVAHELELPVSEMTEYKDGSGNVTRIQRIKDHAVTGDYITSAGKKGDAAWGSRGNWCMLYGRRTGTPISITIIDHPANLGYPTYWHARKNGLLAANPFGQKIFSNGATNLNFKMLKGKSIRFLYRTVITAGLPVPFTGGIEKWVQSFESMR
ncbi:MAG: PmoA family protein [Bacteroidota bacterium]|jgi:hypothetical protein